MAGQLQTRRRGLVALSTVAGLLLVGWLAGLPWLAGHWPRILAVGLFLAVIAAVAATWQQLDTDRRQLRQQLEVSSWSCAARPARTSR